MLFDKDFYPTPKNVIRKMLEPYMGRVSGEYRSEYNIETMSILEPSAGKGDIVEFISDLSSSSYYHEDSKKKIYTIERNPDLKYILQEKGYKVISDDFLQYNGDYFFDLIIMNPPFSNGDEHLLKAWDILQAGDIVCLLNAETIKNPYTEKRKLIAKIIEDNNGTVEYLGNCFRGAEVSTDVEVVLVRLTKKANSGKLDFDFETVTKESQFELNEEILTNQIAVRDVIGNMILQYDALKLAFIDYVKAQEKMKFYFQGLADTHKDLEDVLKHVQGSNAKQKYNSFADNMKSVMWKNVFEKTHFDKYMTHRVRENFQQFSEQQGAMDFTKENIANVFRQLVENRESILDQAIIEVFDIFTKYHNENRCHVEGWKTNDKWKVNKKVILPYWVTYGEYGIYKFSLSFNKWSEYSDIDKVMSYITGIKDYVSLADSLKERFDHLGYIEKGKVYNEGESTFFKYKFFKKGTLHIEFKDASLWEEFNMRACFGKKWLPEVEVDEWKKRKAEQRAKSFGKVG